MTNPQNVFAQASSEGSEVLLPHNKLVQQPWLGEGPKPRILVFDVNETMLDLNALRPQFEHMFGSGAALDEWFSLLLQYSMVVTLTDAYSDFGTVGKATLQMLADGKGVQLSAEDKTRLMQGVLSLPPHPEMLESLKRLRTAGFRMVTLTNSSPTAVNAQLQNAGLAEYFEESISVDSVRRFKPDLQVYWSAATHLHAKSSELLLIAAHAWDVFGAMQAGWHAAFISRHGRPLFPLGTEPDIVATDMKGVADALL
ncbi:MAG: haloacid dehalogenase type II [Methylobacter sp.]|nr:haloacid dehalogenase type II [Methylobacter sp.]